MEDCIEKMMEQLNSGESKTIFKNISCIVISGLTKSGRIPWQEEEETRKRYQYCTDSSGAILYLRALQGQSGRSLIDPTLQDNVVIPDGVFKYIHHVGCAINLNSIINSGLIAGGQKLSNRQTVFFLPLDPMDKNHNDPDTIDLNAPLHAQHMHKAWKKHQNTVYWVDINLALKKGFKFYRTRSNAIVLHETLPAYCIPKVVRMETEEVIYEKVHASPRPPPNISLKHDWMKELGSEVAQRPEGQVVQQSKSSQSNQPNPNPDHDRTQKPVVCRDASHAQGAIETSRSQDIETRSFMKEAVKHDRTETPFVCRDTNHAQGARQTRSLMAARASTLKTKQIMIERGHLLFAVTQVTRKVTSNQCWTRLTLTSEHLDCHILLWNKLITLVFVNWSRRSRTTLTDILFNEIYNKTKPTTHSVQRQRKRFRTWAT